jgi:outer membrane biosynthesis protein TonB
MTDTTIYICFGILALAVIVLALMFLNFQKKMDASAEQAEINAKAHANNKINELDKKTPKYYVDGNGEVELRTPDGKYPIHYWKLDKTEKKQP